MGKFQTDSLLFLEESESVKKCIDIVAITSGKHPKRNNLE